MAQAIGFKEAMGALAVVIAVVAYAIYFWQSLRGSARPHPLSWLIFGILTGTAYLVQLGEAAGPGTWVMGFTTAVCLMLCVMSFWRGERSFALSEWAFLGAATVVFLFYLLSREPALWLPPGAARDALAAHAATISAILATGVNVLGFGPTIAKAWQRPHTDSATLFFLNGIKFIPALFALNGFNIAITLFPVALLIVNVAVALLIYLRRRTV